MPMGSRSATRSVSGSPLRAAVPAPALETTAVSAELKRDVLIAERAGFVPHAPISLPYYHFFGVYVLKE